MDVFHERCAGLDVHKDVIFLCALLGPGRKVERYKQKFGAFPHQLQELRAKLVELRVTHLVMESTGVYWMPIYDALEGAVEIVVGNAQHIMNVPGRKTDESDAEWLAKLLRFGLVKPSFVPPRYFRELRQMTRYRRNLVQAHASEQNRVEKHLQIAGIKLSSVTSYVLGVSGTDMLEHIAKGQTDPEQLANLARGRLRKKVPQLQVAFPSSISEHTQRMIAIQLEQLNRLDATIAEADVNISSKVESHLTLLQRLDTLPGVNLRLAVDLLAEMGDDMSAWASHRQFAAMAGVCPGNYISAGKRLKNRSRQGNPYLKTLLVQAAASAINVKGSYLQAKFLRLKQRRGHKRALVAIAHALAVAIYHMLKNSQDYRELGAQSFAEDDRNRKTQSLIKQLQSIGYSVALTPVAQQSV